MAQLSEEWDPQGAGRHGDALVLRRCQDGFENEGQLHFIGGQRHLLIGVMK